MATPASNEAMTYAAGLMAEYGIVGASDNEREIILRAIAIAYLAGDIKATRELITSEVSALRVPEPQSLRVQP